MNKKIVIGIVAFLIVVGLGAAVAINTSNKNTHKDNTKPPGTTEQKNPSKPAEKPKDTQAPAPKPPEEVVEAHKDDIYVDPGDTLAKTYPGEMVPLYKVSGIADSNEITTANGQTGWATSYGSAASVDDVIGFYSDFLSSTSGYTKTPTDSGANLSGIKDGYKVDISINPNNPNRTGLDYPTSVNIFIEKAQ